jgi:phosphoenolpyruvate carboxylase
MTPKYLDPKLRDLVKATVATLGEVIQRNVGRSLYNKIENIRRDMTQLRRGSYATKMRGLQRAFNELEKLTEKEQFFVAHSFALMLEIMNVCENAYRTHSIKGRKPQFHPDRLEGIFYVLTAHPTEARSPENVAIFSELQTVLVETLDSFFPWHRETIRSVIEKAWHTPITRQRKPQVADEAEYIYSIVLNPRILNALLKVKAEVAPLFLRSWVGGDKDGHPGVNAETMVTSLSLSRRRLVNFVIERLQQIEADLILLKQTPLSRTCKSIRWEISRLKTILVNDGAKLTKLKDQFDRLTEEYVVTFGSRMPAMVQVAQVFKMFPGLVIPLELRESSDLVESAARTKQMQPISRMLSRLQQISKGGNPRWYVRGFIISMCGSMTHIEAGLTLVKRYFGEPKLPVIPLFEQEAALSLSSKIVKEMLANPFIQSGIREFWHNRLEVMLGYSDSAKEVGALQSRLLISETVKKIEKLCIKAGVTPVFFHGSGGSVDRGGGSIQEQTAWLSRESLKLFKATVQGEMVERTFSSPEIFRSGIDHLAEQIASAYKAPRHARATVEHSRAIHEFATRVSVEYKQAIHSDTFLEIVHKATPYRFLSALKLGSRPSRRGRVTNVLNLRAIPWVLCWTQTRILFPVWWGTGTAWQATSATQKAALKKDFHSNPLFRSYLKVLGFTLAKVELPIWEMYLRKSGIDSARVTEICRSFVDEYQSSVAFVKEVTDQTSLLWYRPWLRESIQLRSPMIHPLNLLQIIIMERQDPVMMRETVAGIANGMLTTG